MGFVFGAFGYTDAFVRMNSHLHENPHSVPANCRCELIRTGEFLMPVGFVFGAFGHTCASVRMNSHLHVNPEPILERLFSGVLACSRGAKVQLSHSDFFSLFYANRFCFQEILFFSVFRAASMAFSITFFRGTPFSRAAALQSSYSGKTFNNSPFLRRATL